MSNYLKWALRLVFGIISLFYILIACLSLLPPMKEYGCEGHADINKERVMSFLYAFISTIVLWWVWKKTKTNNNE